MYRKEDMLRAYHLDLEKFGAQVINFFPISNKEKFIQVNFYEEIIFKMQEQGIETSGHLEELNELVKTLSKLIGHAGDVILDHDMTFFRF